MRLKSHIWVSAYLRRLDASFISGVVVHRGDADAGSVYIKVSYLDGTCQIYMPISAYMSETLHDGLIMEDGRAWQAMYPSPASETEADRYLNKQVSMDADVWVLEVESADGKHYLNEAALVTA